MNKIQVMVVDKPTDPGHMMANLARMTQRGHEIADGMDLWELFHKSASDKLIGNLATMPHGTIKRFETYTVAIVGASRRFLAQIRTHQHADFVSGSLQYSDWSSNENAQKAFVVPYELLDKPDLRSLYLHSCVDSFERYKVLADHGSNDAAGFIMPNGLRNVLVIHASIQEWQYIIGLRTCKRNSLETRYVCYKIWEALYETPKGELLFSPKNTGSWCQTGTCREGRMSCGEPIPTDMTPTQMLHQYFPLCYKED